MPEVEELGQVCHATEDLLLALAASEEDSAGDPEPWVLPVPLAAGQAMEALDRILEVLRGTVDQLALPPVDPDASTRPRLWTGSRERVPLRAVPIAAGDRRTLAAAAAQIELAQSATARRTADNPWERKRLSDLAELLEQIGPDNTAGEARPLIRLSSLLNLPPDDDTALLVGVVRAGADIELTASQSEAYGRTATRINAVLTGGDPLARWLY